MSDAVTLESKTAMVAKTAALHFQTPSQLEKVAQASGLRLLARKRGRSRYLDLTR
jgi:hypothetical protein